MVEQKAGREGWQRTAGFALAGCSRNVAATITAAHPHTNALLNAPPTPSQNPTAHTAPAPAH